MRITSKGQVTIPQHIREQAGLLPMTEVEFGFQEGVVTLRAAAPGTAGDRGAAILGRRRRSRISGPARPWSSTR